jgi:protein TonB
LKTSKLRILFFIAFFTFFSASAQQDTTVYSYVDQEAEFPGGVAAMMAWVQKNLIYPSDAIEHSLTDSRTYISFIVESNGTLSQIIINSKCESCKKSILTLMQNSPNWIPAVLNGNYVRSRFILPLNICLE